MFGNLILSILFKPLNAFAITFVPCVTSTSVSVSATVPNIDAKRVLPSFSSPINGTVIFSRVLHPENASAPIFSTDVGTTNVLIESAL